MTLSGLGSSLERILMDENFTTYILFNGKLNLTKSIKTWFYLLVNRTIVLAMNLSVILFTFFVLFGIKNIPLKRRPKNCKYEGIL